MDKRYLVDTNIIIYYLNDEIPEESLPKVEEILSISFQGSTISRIEVLGWKGISEDLRQQITSFLSEATIFYVDADIEEGTIKIKQKHKIKTPDAVIAATALLNDCILVTRNEKDFVNIEGLVIYNPFRS
ncbi:MAG: type II toxin-antitoxin system VapC family toxin [Bacteroidota bacterium]